MGIIDQIKHHLKHRLNPKTIAMEMANHLTDKVIPQGCDEVANALFNHSAYLPWPGSSGPAPIEAPPIGLHPAAGALDGIVMPPEPFYGFHPDGTQSLLETPIIDGEAPSTPDRLSYTHLITDAAIARDNDQGMSR